MGNVIAVISGKGGVGKTTTTANIGLGIALNNKRCVVVDFDIGRILPLHVSGAEDGGDPQLRFVPNGDREWDPDQPPGLGETGNERHGFPRVSIQ